MALVLAFSLVLLIMVSLSGLAARPVLSTDAHVPRPRGSTGWPIAKRVMTPRPNILADVPKARATFRRSAGVKECC